jgi:hypothetical protein
LGADFDVAIDALGICAHHGPIRGWQSRDAVTNLCAVRPNWRVRRSNST